MEYNSLDDLPISIRRNLGSPAPTHYSVVTNTPSPNPHNRQVMSPNLTTSHDTTTPSASTTPPALAAAAEEQQQQAGVVTVQQMTRISLPADTLRAFQTSIGEDLSFAADIQAAVTELSSRVQYRTEILAGAVGSIGGSVADMQAGCQQLAIALEQLQDKVNRQQVPSVEQILSDLQRQGNIIQSLVESRDQTRHELDQLKTDLQKYLDNKNQEVVAVKHQLDISLQREAKLLATVETLSGQFAELERSTHSMEQSLTEHRRRLDTHEAIVYAPSEGSADGASTAQAVRALAERVETELAVLKDSFFQQDDALESLRQNCSEANDRLDAWDKYLDATELSAKDNTEAKSPEFGASGNSNETSAQDVSGATGQALGGSENATVFFNLTPDISEPPTLAVPEDSESGWWNSQGPQEGPTENPTVSTIWNLTEPPGLPAWATEKGAEEPKPIHHGRWKLLNDVPGFTAGGGEPWEVCMRLKTWWRQVETVAGTVDSRFGAYVSGQFAEAERRHKQRLEGQFQLPRPDPVPEANLEMESRLTLLLIRCLPAELKQPVLENLDEQTIRALELLEGILEQQQPGGHQEMKSLQSFIRHMDPAPTAKEAQESLRRWKLARTRAATLGLPAVAPFEELQALGSLVKTLERRTDTFRTLLGLIRTRPEVVRPSPAGVTGMVQLIEQQLQLLCAEENIKRNRREADEMAQAAKGKTKKGKGKGEKGNQGGKGEAKTNPGKTSGGPQGSGKGTGTDSRKNMPCHSFWTAGGCQRQPCPFSHDEKHKPKAKDTAAKDTAAAQALIGVDGTAAQAAQPKPKPKPKSKAKASSVVSVANMARRTEGDNHNFDTDSSDSGSALSEVSAGLVGSGNSTPSVWSSNRGDEDPLAEMLEAMDLARADQEDLSYLILDPDEYIRWRQPGIAHSQAHRQWREVDMGPDAPPNVAIAIWMVLRHSDFETPLMDMEISPSQDITRLDQILIGCEDGIPREGYVAWCVDFETGGEVFMTVTRRSYNPLTRPYVPVANKASMSRVEDCVLLDTGANEIVRTGCGPKPVRSKLSPLQLADGSQVEAWRTRDGDIFVESQDGNTTLCGVCRLISVGAAFSWDREGAHLRMPSELGGDWVSLQIQNGLPYLNWDHFKRLRPLLSKDYKSCCSAAVCDMKPCPKVVDWSDLDDLVAEQESLVEANKAVHRDGEEMAKQLLQKGGDITLADVNRVLKEAKLPAARTNRMNKVNNTETKLNLWVFGGWKKGGLGGVTRATHDRPWLTKVLTHFMRSQTSEPFMAITVSQDVVFTPRRDPNDCDFASTLVGLTNYKGGELWVEPTDKTADVSNATWRLVKAGEPARPGALHPTANGQVVQFFGNQFHGTEEYTDMLP